MRGVLDYFYIQTMEEGGKKKLEFLAPGATRKTHDKMQWTPRKYTFGSVYPCPNSWQNTPFRALAKPRRISVTRTVVSMY